MDDILTAEELRARVYTLYRNVKYLRKQHGLTKKELAKIIHISEKKLNLSETCWDTGYFRDYHIKNICEYFNISPNTLYRTKLFEQPDADTPPVMILKNFFFLYIDNYIGARYNYIVKRYNAQFYNGG